MATEIFDRDSQTEKRLRDLLRLCPRRIGDVLLQLKRRSAAMVGSRTSLVFCVVRHERSSAASKNSITAGRSRRRACASAWCWSKKRLDSETPEDKNLIQCIEFRTAGDPDEEDIIYTDLSPQDLSERLSKRGTPVGKDAIAQWLDEAGIRRRQIRKDVPGGEHPNRNCQFERIAELTSHYESTGNPWFSMDT